MMRLIEREPRGEGSLHGGQDLVIAGYAGWEGSKRIAKEKEAELFAWFSREYVEKMQQETPVKIDHVSIPWQEYGAWEWEEVGEGGIFTALWNLSGAYRTGFEVNLHSILVRQETIEVCERYDLNPYRLYSGDCMLVAADNGLHLVQKLETMGAAAAVIGQVKPGIKREIFYGQVRGFLERPREDEIYKIVRRKNHERENFSRYGEEQQNRY